MGLSLQLWFCGVVGFNPQFFFFFFFLGGGVESFLLLGRGWEFFFKFCLVWVVLVLLCFLRFFLFFVMGWKFINICSIFIHSHNFFCVLWGSVSVGRCAFFVFGLSNI